MPHDLCCLEIAYGEASAANFTSVRVERDDVSADSTLVQIAAQTPMVTGGASGAYKGVLTIGISA